MIYDLAIAGGGPAGLATAIRAAQKGLRAVVVERSAEPPDKACGEGLMPSGARELEDLGVRVDESAAFRGIRYVQEDGSAVEARFRDGDGLGIRRTVLAKALRDRALACGAEVRHATVQSAQPREDRIALVTNGGEIEARLAVAADGLHSPLRRAAGLEIPGRGLERFGVRRHYAIEPWTDFVEVHWNDGVEAYVTPVGPKAVNVAFLTSRKPDFDELLAGFPRLRVENPLSETRGAGPLLQRVKARHAGRLALVGDAAGYVDAITGQGLSLAFHAARALLEALPRDLSTDLTPALRSWDSGLRLPWLRYALPAHGLVALSRRPALRRRALRALSGATFGNLIHIVG